MPIITRACAQIVVILQREIIGPNKNMKKLLFIATLLCWWLMPVGVVAQTTEGTDFWVTLLRGDDRNYDELSLTFSAKEDTWVYVENTYTGLNHKIYVPAGTIARDTLCTKNNKTDEASCYVTDADAEVVSNHALHVTSDNPISLIAANYKNKSFDVAAILPTTALMSEYRIQCYTPYAHADTEQGSHFAIVAAENNTVVDYQVTEGTSKGSMINTTYTTPVMQAGQVFYVWSGPGQRRDLTGSIVKARDNKKIAVFNGNSHTNIPTLRDRDHIYSQAMPVNYWGKRFIITSSRTTIDGKAGFWERIDKIRVQALVDSTTIYVDGDSVYTISFAANPKHYYEFDFGAKDEMTNYSGDGHRYFEGSAHYIETSCPSAVHLFMTSNRYDHNSGSYCNGDPSEMWVNPVEQKIKQLTFGTFQTQQVQDHFLNIVTTADNVASVELDGNNIANQFTALATKPEYVYARLNITNGTHTLTSDSGFIAHVYGFGEKESYSYPAGGETKDLTAFITINGKVYKADGDNKICGDDKVTFGCELNYEYDSIYWNFGDGADSLATQLDSIEHVYERPDHYNAYVLIYRHMGEDDGCVNFNAVDSIAFMVNIGNFKIDIERTIMPACTHQGDAVDYLIYLNNPGKVDMTGDSVTIAFNEAAQKDGFTEESMTVTDTLITIHIPTQAKNRTTYGLHIHIGSECPNSVLDKDLEFSLQFDIPFLAQRFNDVLGILRDSFPTADSLFDFVWFRDGDTIPNQQNSVLNLYGQEDFEGEYHVCFTIREHGKADVRTCSCPIKFSRRDDVLIYQEGSDSIAIGRNSAYIGEQVFVNARSAGKATWYNPDGSVYSEADLPEGGGLIKAPQKAGLYVLSINAGLKRKFKFIVFN